VARYSGEVTTMAVMEIKVFPLGTQSTSVSAFVAAAVRAVKESGLSYRLTPMGTVVEGSVDALLALAARVHETPFEAGAERVVTTIEIDDRRDKPISMDGKVRSVEEKLA